MFFRLSLARALTDAELPGLVDALCHCDAVAIDPRRDTLRGRTSVPVPQILDRGLGAALDGLGTAWRWEEAEHDGLSLTGSCASVLTVQFPASGPLPALGPALVGRDVAIAGLRRHATGERVTGVELYLRDASADAALRGQRDVLAARWDADVNLMDAALKRPRRRLFVFDMDSTLIRCEVIDELAARAGVGHEVAAITARAMRGELDFRSSFRERMARLRGLPADVIEDISSTLPIMPGAAALLRELRDQGHYTAILSGGFDVFAQRVQALLGVHEVHANHLQLRDGRLTGEVEGPIIDGQRKVALLEELARKEGFSLGDTVAVGDGANDIPMLLRAGLGVAFHAKPRVRELAPCSLSRVDLTGLLDLIGSPRSASDITPDRFEG